MRCKCVPEVERFAQQFAVDAGAGDMILSARPERTALFLSAGLLASNAKYVLGHTVDNGIVFNVAITNPFILFTKDDLGDMVGLPLWNGGTALLRARGNEEWEKPTGRTIKVPVE